MSLRKPIQSASLYFGGPVRNVASVIETELDNLYTAFSGFKKVFCHVVESDSSDDTLSVLERLSKKYPNFSYESKGQLEALGLRYVDHSSPRLVSIRLLATKSST